MLGKFLYEMYVDEMAPATTDEFDPWEDLNPVHQRAWKSFARKLDLREEE